MTPHQANLTTHPKKWLIPKSGTSKTKPGGRFLRYMNFRSIPLKYPKNISGWSWISEGASHTQPPKNDAKHVTRLISPKTWLQKKFPAPPKKKPAEVHFMKTKCCFCWGAFMCWNIGSPQDALMSVGGGFRILQKALFGVFMARLWRILNTPKK